MLTTCKEATGVGRPRFAGPGVLEASPTCPSSALIPETTWACLHGYAAGPQPLVSLGSGQTHMKKAGRGLEKQKVPEPRLLSKPQICLCSEPRSVLGTIPFIR